MRRYGLNLEGAMQWFLFAPLLLLLALGYQQGISHQSIATGAMYLNQSNRKIPHNLLNGSRIVLSEENYVGGITEIFFNLEKYQGKEIEMKGFVYRNNSHEENQFIVARIITNCCAEDGEISGILCYLQNAEVFQDNTWVKVQGVLQSITYYHDDKKREQSLPIVIVEEIEKVEEPEIPYVRP